MVEGGSRYWDLSKGRRLVKREKGPLEQLVEEQGLVEKSMIPGYHLANKDKRVDGCKCWKAEV
jgi:hypothetical protein